MSKNLKKKITKMNLILVCSAVLLASCTKKKEETKQSTSKNFEFVEKETKYKKDETTEVLIDAEIKKDDIVRSYKHGDNWQHVLFGLVGCVQILQNWEMEIHYLLLVLFQEIN